MLRFEQAVENNKFSKSLISRKLCSFWKIEVYHLMLIDTPNVMTELAPKGPRFVEISEIIDRPDILFACDYVEARD